MVDRELNFKDFSDDSYRVMRILQSHHDMTKTYQTLLKKIGKYRSAMMFPEHFVAIGGSPVYWVKVYIQPWESTISIGRLDSAYITNDDGDRLTTLSQILEHERAGDTDTVGWLSSREGKPYSNLVLGEKHLAGTDPITYYFANKNDAGKFAASQVKFP